MKTKIASYGFALPCHGKKRLATVLLAVASLAHGADFSPDGVSFEAGSGNKTDMARLGVAWKWDKVWYQTGDWQLTNFWELSIGRWKGKAFPTINGQAGHNTQELTDIGFTPVFRFAKTDALGLYYEIAVGAHYLSEIYDTNTRKFSTKFQFGDHIGIGYVWKLQDNSAIDAAIHFQHLSNGSIKQPNPGVNFLQAKLQYWF